MIKIEIQAESGLEAREQLMALLGTTGINTPKIHQEISEPKIAIVPEEVQKEQSIEIKDLSTEAVAEGIKEVTKKRRTKAEIEADNAAKATPAETPAANEPSTEEKSDETPATETQASTIQVKDLQAQAVALARSGKREVAQTVLKKYGAKSFTAESPLASEHYQAVYDEFLEALK